MFKLIFLMSLHNINPLPFCSFFSQCSFETFFQISKAKKKMLLDRDVETEQCQDSTF